MELDNTRTLQCLVNAYAGESQARNRYTFFSKVAKEEGYEKISEIFYLTSENEKEHAKLFYKHIPNNHYLVNANYPFFYSNTYENLISSYEGEKEEWEEIYKNSAEIAKEEGFTEISKLFRNILEIEKRHSHRFKELAETLNNGEVFKKTDLTQWICRKCGHTQITKEAPCICPVCKHPQGYFELFIEKF